LKEIFSSNGFGDNTVLFKPQAAAASDVWFNITISDKNVLRLSKTSVSDSLSLLLSMVKNAESDKPVFDFRSDFSPTETDKKPIETIADKLANTAHDWRDHLRKRAIRKLICRLFSFKISFCFQDAKLMHFCFMSKSTFANIEFYLSRNRTSPEIHFVLQG